MPEIKYSTLGELIYWSYSNLAMAHMGVEKKHDKYSTIHYVIRAKLFKGLKDGTMNMRSIFDDEKIKLNTGKRCNYCGTSDNLTLDHILPKYEGGKDDAENLILACKSCNSSKGKKDLMEWMHSKNEFLPLMIIRRYLKLVYHYAERRNILNLSIQDVTEVNLPFQIKNIPINFPPPDKLKLNVE